MDSVVKFQKAVVTGGAGFIGSHIVEALLQERIEPVVIDDFSTGRYENVPSGVNVVQANILDRGTARNCFKDVDVVFHNAAKVSIRNSVNNFYHDAEVNVMGTLSLLRELAKSKVKKLIYASSMAVYGETKTLPITENYPLNPISPYGISKLTGEQYCLQICRTLGINVIILRYFNTFGIRQTLTPYVGVITIFINRLLEGKFPVIFGSGEQIRDFVSVKDVARANILAMKGDSDSEIFNVGTGKGTTINQLADFLIARFGGKAVKEYALKQTGEPGNSIADVSKIRKVMGFEAKDKLEDELPYIIKWIKDNRKD